MIPITPNTLRLLRLLFHTFVFLLILSTAFFPLSWMRYGLFVVPYVVSVTWVVCDGCMFNPRRANGTRQNDLHTILQRLGWNLPEHTVKFMVYSGMVLLPTIVAGRALWALQR